MRKVLMSDLEMQKPDVHYKIDGAMDKVIPVILSHVAETMAGVPVGSVSEHLTFMRAVEDDDNVVFLGIETHFMKLPGGVGSRVHSVTFYNNQVDYDEARLMTEAQSEEKFGKSFPSTRDFNGEKIEI